ncbi:MAG: hypothetical protein DRG25_01865 [Deltaproteobacteria bacterium]|nr:MAG: hypothetical protein DRG25_01865 [Deltaproteobacteria bacterium]
MTHNNDLKFICPAIFLLSAASLHLEVTYTRIFSISQGYYFAFMVVSIALLGIGASGSFLMSWPKMAHGPLCRLLSNLSLFFGISCLFSYLTANLIPFDLVCISWDWHQILWIGTYYLLISLPFFFTGLTISIALFRLPDKVNFLYFSDLTGAAIGCWIIYTVLGPTDEPGSVLVSAVMGIFASILFGIRNYRFPCIHILTLICIIILLLYSPEWLQIRISPYKSLMSALRYPGAQLVSTKSDPYSRIDVVDSPAVRFAPGLSLKFKQTIPSQIGLVLDGGQLNAVTNFNGDKNRLTFTSYLPAALPYSLKSIDKFLCLEPRGGLDILTAIYYDVKSITAVCPYPLIIKTVRDELREFSGGLYLRKDVTLYCEGIRSFFQHDAKKYDLIQYSLTDVSGAVSTGIYGMSENYILTKEAILAYYSHLNEGGFLLFNCYLLPPPRTEFRLISLLLDTLEAIPGTSPSHQVITIRSWGTMVTLLKKGPVTPDECNRLKEFCQRRGFDLVYYPGIILKEANQFNQFPEPIYFQGVQKLINPQVRKHFLVSYPFDLDPPSDDKPFFNQFFKISHLYEAYKILGRKWQPFFEGEYIVPIIFFQSLILGTLFILFPLFFLQKRKAKNRGKVFLFYFVWIGFGFMFVEIALIQRFILFLDHPVKSVTVILSGLLVSAGIGSSLSSKIINRFPRRGTITPFFTGVVILIYAFSLILLLNLGLKIEPIFRTVSAFIIIFPLGFFMGMPFPLGILVLNRNNPDLIPWAWGVNGCASVVGAVLAVMIALRGGFSTVLFISSLLYLLAGLWMGLYNRIQSSEGMLPK